jgi:glycosyltransferase involved in cell wall biosynthesis
MKILISSHAFAPSIGGIETVSASLAEEFSRRGHSVRVVTQTPGESADKVARRPSIGQLVDLLKWCDVFWQNNLSLRTIWPALVMRKPIVVTHQGSYCRRPTGSDLALRAKHVVASHVTGVAISEYVASFFHPRPIVIPNPFDAAVFGKIAAAQRALDLIFVGRLVTEKGVDLLLRALRILGDRGSRPELTIVGSGPEESNLRGLTSELSLDSQVTFAGPKRGIALAEEFNRHRILVVPSRYDEPFGVVALEGIACGCVVIGSSGGGLPEAIGPCGITFPNGDPEGLADKIRMMLNAPAERERLVINASTHLARFHPSLIANSYLELFQAKLQ